MVKKTKQEVNVNKPWVSNYPPLQQWLQKIGARCLQQTPVGTSSYEDDTPQAYFETWQVNSHVFLVEVRAMQMGWNVWTECGVNSLEETFADAEKRLGL